MQCQSFGEMAAPELCQYKQKAAKKTTHKLFSNEIILPAVCYLFLGSDESSDLGF